MSDPSNVSVLMDPNALVWCGTVVPGNGSVYRYCVWSSDDQWFAAFPDFQAASAIGTGNHWTYIQEKMKVSTPDAKVMAQIINAIQEQA